MKIAILGYSGAGKSTLARQLGGLYHLPVLHLDTVQFLPGWKERPADESRRLVRRFMEENDCWVIDGNYSSFYQLQRLQQAGMIIILNYSRLACLWYALRRYQKNKGRTRADMTPGCPEKLDAAFIRWILWDGRTGAVRRRYRQIALQYPEKLALLKNRRQANRWLAGQRALATGAQAGTARAHSV